MQFKHANPLCNIATKIIISYALSKSVVGDPKIVTRDQTFSHDQIIGLDIPESWPPGSEKSSIRPYYSGFVALRCLIK